MRRRGFLALAGGAALWPACAVSQQPGRVYRLGVLGPSPDRMAIAAMDRVVLDELRQFGFHPGENLVVEHRPEDDPRGAEAVAADLARGNPDAFVVFATDPDVAVKAFARLAPATPIVLAAFNYDPIQRGYAARLLRPGGNVTGIALRQSELAVRQLEMLTQAVPSLRVGILWDAMSADQFAVAAKVASSVQLQVHALELENPPYDFAAAFKTLAADGIASVLVLSRPHRADQDIGGIALKHRLATMFAFKGYAQAGGLMAYGADEAAASRRLAVCVAKILNGTRPADLPIEQVRDYEFYVNIRTAKALGLLLPEALLVRADEIIE